MIEFLKALFGGGPAPIPEAETYLIYVYLPEALEPEEREERYGDPLDAELKLAGLGYVSGGGSLLDTEDEDGRRRIIYSGVDVDAYDTDAARRLLRDHLPDLGCRTGTGLQFEDHEGAWEDIYDGSVWLLRQSRRTSDVLGDD